MTRSPRRFLLTLSVSILGALSLLGVAGAAPAFAGAPRLSVITRSDPTLIQPGKQAEVVTVLTNVGDEPLVATETSPLVIKETLPPGLEATHEGLGGRSETGAEGPTLCAGLSCKFVGTIQPYGSINLVVRADTKSTFTGGQTEVTVEGAGVATQPIVQMLSVSEGATPFGVERFELTAETESGTADLSAGGHPFALTDTFELNQVPKSSGTNGTFPGTPALVKNVDTTLPAGLIGNPLALPRCSDADFASVTQDVNACPADTVIGVAVVTLNEPGLVHWTTMPVPVFNLEPAEGEPARLGFEFVGVPVTVTTSILTGEGYAVSAKVHYASEAAEVLGTTVVVWGVPQAEVHDNSRGWGCLAGGLTKDNQQQIPCEALANKHPNPYLTLPTECTEGLAGSVQVQSWEPGAPLLPALLSPQPQLSGCGSLPFTPTINVAPDEHTASTPTGLNVEVNLPQETTLAESGPAEAAVYETELALPEGLTTNAGGASGLATCSLEQVGFRSNSEETLEANVGAQLFTSAAAACPAAANMGEVHIRTPLLEEELTGAVYLGEQDTNPFASPLVLYIVAEAKKAGVLVKLAGETRISETGQLTSVFKNTPPVPFETLKLHLTDGPRATLATPAYCRAYESRATFTPWSGEEPAQRGSSFAPEAGPNGGACQSSGPLPFSPSFQAGSTNDQAAGFTGFSVTIGHPDGNQPLKQISVKLPEGLAGVLASVPLCSAAQAEAKPADCPEGSLVGTSTAYAGLGPDTVSLPGKVYLTESIKGAPFGLLDVTEAKAGPFNLGDVDVLSTITVNENTAAVTVTSDPIPEYVDGVPSQIKSLNVNVNRPNFQFNPTNCTPTNVDATLSGYEGTSSNVSSPFDVANCATLPFAPKLTAVAGGHANKVDGTSFAVTVESAGLGQANIRKVLLNLPEALPSRNSTLQKACLEKVFDANPAGCDEGSVIGYGIVHTPVLKNPLSGPAYLVSHGNAAFPDVEFVLQGEGIKLVLDGKTDIKKIHGVEVTFSRFETSPDAPFTKFESVFPAGPHGVLTSYVPKDEYDLCTLSLTMPTTIIAQDGAVIQQTTKIATSGCAPPKTKAQLLSAALKACKKAKKKKRASCETAARRKYSASAADRRHAKKASKKH
jgi:hypothetical protein